MKKAVIRILCLLLGVNVFTACYGPALPPPDQELIQKELEALQQQEEPQVEEPEAEPEAPEQE